MGFKSNLSKSPKVANNITKMFTSRAVVIALVVLVVMVLFTGLFVNMRKSVEGFAATNIINESLKGLENKPLKITFNNNSQDIIVVKTSNGGKDANNYYVIQPNSSQKINVCTSGPQKQGMQGCAVTLYYYDSTKPNNIGRTSEIAPIQYNTTIGTNNSRVSATWTTTTIITVYDMSSGSYSISI